MYCKPCLLEDSRPQIKAPHNDDIRKKEFNVFILFQGIRQNIYPYCVKMNEHYIIDINRILQRAAPRVCM